MNKKTLFLILLSFLILPGIVLAAGLIEDMANNVVKVVINIAGGIVIILWVVTGRLFLSSIGAPEKLSIAKKALFASIAGTVLVILALAAEAIIKSVIFTGT